MIYSFEFETSAVPGPEPDACGLVTVHLWIGYAGDDAPVSWTIEEIRHAGGLITAQQMSAADRLRLRAACAEAAERYREPACAEHTEAHAEWHAEHRPSDA